MEIKESSTLSQEAYRLWEEAPKDLSLEENKKRIIDDLTRSSSIGVFPRICQSFKKNICTFFPSYLERVVDTTLHTYKYNLITTSKESPHLHLFDQKERWFFNHGLIRIFKNLLVQAKTQSPGKSRASCLKTLTSKYYEKPELLVSTALLYRIGEIFPSFRKAIRFILKTASSDYVERQGKRAEKRINDSAITEVLKKYLSEPLAKNKTLFRIGAELSFLITLEKIKIQANKTYSSCSSYALSFLRNIPRPRFFGFAG